MVRRPQDGGSFPPVQLSFPPPGESLPPISGPPQQVRVGHDHNHPESHEPRGRVGARANAVGTQGHGQSNPVRLPALPPSSGQVGVIGVSLLHNQKTSAAGPIRRSEVQLGAFVGGTQSADDFIKNVKKSTNDCPPGCTMGEAQLMQQVLQQSSETQKILAAQHFHLDSVQALLTVAQRATEPVTSGFGSATKVREPAAALGLARLVMNINSQNSKAAHDSRQSGGAAAAFPEFGLVARQAVSDPTALMYSQAAVTARRILSEDPSNISMKMAELNKYSESNWAALQEISPGIQQRLEEAGVDTGRPFAARGLAVGGEHVKLGSWGGSASPNFTVALRFAQESEGDCTINCYGSRQGGENTYLDRSANVTQVSAYANAAAVMRQPSLGAMQNPRGNIEKELFLPPGSVRRPNRTVEEPPNKEALARTGVPVTNLTLAYSERVPLENGKTLTINFLVP